MAEILKKSILHYTAVFEEDSKRGGYTATIPSLPGCISEGNTFEEAQRNIEEAAELYIETMRDNQQEIPEETAVIVAPVHVTA